MNMKICPKSIMLHARVAAKCVQHGWQRPQGKDQRGTVTVPLLAVCSEVLPDPELL